MWYVDIIYIFFFSKACHYSKLLVNKSWDLFINQLQSVTAEVVAAKIILHWGGEGKSKTPVTEQYLRIVCQVVLWIPLAVFCNGEKTTSEMLHTGGKNTFTVQTQATSCGLKWGSIRYWAYEKMFRNDF